MFRLFGRPLPTEPDAAAPEGSVVYAVGDIHGRADLLDTLHGLIVEDAARRDADRRVVVYVGDYVDRGLQSRQTIDLLLDRPLAGFEAVHLLGNHERFLLDFIVDAGAGAGWFRNGGIETLVSYGIRPDRGLATERERLEAAQDALLARLPDRHLRFLHDLKLHHAEGDYLFVHAGLRPGLPLARQTEEDLIWIREEFLNSGADHGKVVVHGHSIVPAPEIRYNRIGIDTGAFASGRLTALVLEGRDRAFLRTGRPD